MATPEGTVTLTPRALEQVKQVRAREGFQDGHVLRVSVVGGGCSGFSYQLDFDDEVRPMDQEFEDKGVKVVVDMKSFLYLAGTELDFSDGLNGKGFFFNNPNASRTCRK